MILRLVEFNGELPIILPRNLPDSVSQFSLDVRDGQRFAPIRDSELVTTLPAPTTEYKTIYRHNGAWLGWENYVKAIPGAVALDRLYIFGDGAPKIRVADTEYLLALPSPSTKLTESVTGTATSDSGTNRLYVYTNVTSLGEESAPCDISDGVYWKPGQDVVLSGFETPPAGRLITKQRIYRSQQSFSGTQLYYIDERPASNSNYTDSISSSKITSALKTLGYNAPIDTLEGAVSFPGGVMVAFSGKDLWFCEPYKHEAWPESYMQSVDEEIVALGVFGHTVAIMTKGNLYVTTGYTPDSMTLEKLELNLPCVNAQGVEDMGYSIVYPTHSGLVSVDQSGARLITMSSIGIDKWKKFTPEGFVSGQYNGRYIAAYKTFDARTGTEISGSLVIDATLQTPYISRLSVFADAFYYALETGELFHIIGRNISKFNSEAVLAKSLTWVSKDFYLRKPSSFGAVYIDAANSITADELAIINEQIDLAIAANAVLFATASLNTNSLNDAEVNHFALNASDMNPLVLDPSAYQNININVYADDRLIATITTANKLSRLPAGFLAKKWVIEIVSNIPIDAVTMANTGFELSQVQ